MSRSFFLAISLVMLSEISPAAAVPQVESCRHMEGEYAYEGRSLVGEGAQYLLGLAIIGPEDSKKLMEVELPPPVPLKRTEPLAPRRGRITHFSKSVKLEIVAAAIILSYRDESGAELVRAPVLEEWKCVAGRLERTYRGTWGGEGSYGEVMIDELVEKAPSGDLRWRGTQVRTTSGIAGWFAQPREFRFDYRFSAVRSRQ